MAIDSQRLTEPYFERPKKTETWSGSFVNEVYTPGDTKAGLDAHDRGVKVVSALLRENQLENVVLITGGVIPPEDIPVLKEMGVAPAATGVYPLNYQGQTHLQFPGSIVYHEH